MSYVQRRMVNKGVVLFELNFQEYRDDVEAVKSKELKYPMHYMQ